MKIGILNRVLSLFYKMTDPAVMSEYPGNGWSLLSGWTFYRFSFRFPPEEIGCGVIVNTVKGDRVLAKVIKRDTPSDPGDQHFMTLKPIRVLDAAIKKSGSKEPKS